MKPEPKIAFSSLALFALLVCAALLSFSFPAIAQSSAAADSAEALATGQKLLRDPSKGNCVACHRIGTESGARAATVGPALVDIKNKFPDRKALLAAIGEWDQQHPDTIMPPYRRNRILTESEIDLIAQYLETL